MEEIKQIPVENLVFIDECGVNLSMTRSHARAPLGKRAHASCPKKTNNISLVGAMRNHGVDVLYPYDGPIDGERFLSFLDEHLIPTLKDGDVVVMDNLRVHHIPDVRKRLLDVGARALYLPPYSPELNPIEEAWSQVKRSFRDAEARTISEFVNAMKHAQASVKPHIAESYFMHAGYF